MPINVGEMPPLQQVLCIWGFFSVVVILAALTLQGIFRK